MECWNDWAGSAGVMLYRILDFRLPIFDFEILEQFELSNFENMLN